MASALMKRQAHVVHVKRRGKDRLIKSLDNTIDREHGDCRNVPIHSRSKHPVDEDGPSHFDVK